MVWSEADLIALDAAIMNGIRAVTYADGRKVEYHSLDEMRRLRADMKAELLAAASLVRPRRRTTVGRICRR